MIDLANDFFIAKFSLLEDYHFVLREGPWMIFDHYLAIRKWEPNFDPTEAKIDRVTAWVRFPNISIEYFDEAFLMRLGLLIGKPLRVDSTIVLATRGKFSRLVVKLT